MTHDSRRYHRTRRPPFARGYGLLGALGLGGETAGAAGTAAGAAGTAGTAGTAASGLGTAAAAAAPVLAKIGGAGLAGLGKTALSGIESVGQGLSSLFTGGGSEASRLAALGQAVPEGVELAGPSSTFTGPGFLHSVYQGFIGAPQHFADASAGTLLGTGVGQLMDALQQFQQQGGGPAKMPPIVTPGAMPRPPVVIPSAPAQVATGPIMSLLKPIGSL